MTSIHKSMLSEWYNRVVFGVIAVALVTLACQGTFTVEPTMHASQMGCGATASNPCYVRIPALERTIQTRYGVSNDHSLRVLVINKQ